MAKEKPTVTERYFDEVLTDNTALDKYRQCKDCIFRDDGTVYSNHYQKGCCRMFPYPRFKPNEVMLNQANCEYYEQEKRKK